ncbi:MAG: RNase H family protein [Terriglobales bacterium]
MQLDPRAVHIRTDGSCYRERRMISGCAAIVDYPDHLGRPPEQIVDFGCAESSVNRMELLAVIKSLGWIRENRPWPGVSRVQVITDSQYVATGAHSVEGWRANKWRKRTDEPIENADLWRMFLSAISKVGIVVNIQWTAGKKSKPLKEIDKAAKAAAERGGPDVDRGYSRGALARSLIKGTATRFPAEGQTALIRPYRKNVMRRADGENKIRFDLYSEEMQSYTASHFAYASPAIAFELHRQNGYRVRFNDSRDYPRIIEIVEPVNLPNR